MRVLDFSNGLWRRGRVEALGKESWDSRSDCAQAVRVGGEKGSRDFKPTNLQLATLV